MDQFQLSPCPFCGSPHVRCMEIGLGQWSVGCADCLANGSSMANRQSAVDVWEAVAIKSALLAASPGFLQRLLNGVG